VNKEFNLSWGEPEVVRQALIETLGRFVFSSESIDSLIYPPHLGNPVLIEQLKTLAERHSGIKHKYLIVTCGGTGAINAALYALKTEKTHWVVTNKRYFPFYPKIIKCHGLTQIDKTVSEALQNPQNGCKEDNFIFLQDSPSNPDGAVSCFYDEDIWDAAYASHTYNHRPEISPVSWKIMVGSLSKTLGLPGLRLGFACTDNKELYDKMSEYVTAQTMGLSKMSMDLAETILDNLNQDLFEEKSRNYLDQNREEVQKVLSRFGQGEIPVRGMFVTVQLGKAERRALERAKVKWQPGSTWGENDDWARLSLGASRETIKAAVRGILR
jgi:aspartate/methionine/tyrosine aminotransferase